MAVVLFFKAALIGFCIAAPIGPCGLLCISRSLRLGWRAGLATGVGVVLADVFYAIIGAFGVAALIGVLEKWAGPLRIFGALFLIFLGLRIARKPPENVASSAQGTLLSAFLVTLANPLTIFAFLAIFASLGIGRGHGPAEAILVVAGIGSGSLLWWVLLSCFASHFGKRLSPATVGRISQGAGWIIVALGVAGLCAALRF